MIGNVWYVTVLSRFSRKVVTLLRAIFRNEVDYPQPEVFNPDRFLKTPGKELPPDPASVAAFGFGRR